MRNFVIAFSSFLVLIFIIAFAIGQGDESVTDVGYADETEQVDNFLATNEKYVEPETAEPEKPIEVSEEQIPESESEPIITSQVYDNSAIEIPKVTDFYPEQILVREGYTTSYNKETKCPNWVAWHLTREHTDGPYSRKGVPYYDDDGNAYGIGRVTQKTVKNGYFLDMESEKPRQELTEWSSQYNMSHGHMCPAGDNKWDKAAMNQSFFLTNMCPQDASLNSGAWNKLEEKCRMWAKKYGDIYIVAGPIFRDKTSRYLGHIAIPDAFFKVILCMSGKPKTIGFIYENNSMSQPMNNQVYTVDEIESITGFDFFPSLPDELENVIESTSIINTW